MELIVVGFHRSGTSLVTQLLHAAGLFVGEDLLSALPSNPHGHFEDRDVLHIHRQIMDNNGVGWQTDSPHLFFINPTQWRRMERFVARRQSQHPRWGFKDPRVCHFLGAWKYLLPDARFLIVFRDPAECVRSLESRQSVDYFNGAGDAESHLRFFREPDHGLKSWDAHNRAVVAFARQHVDDCLVLSYDQISAGYPVVRAVNSRFGTDLDRIPTEAVFDSSAAGRRHYPQAVHDPQVRVRVSRTWRSLEELEAMTEARI